MKLGDYAKIRTGLPLSRKQGDPKTTKYAYMALTLKAQSEDGHINLDYAEPYHAIEMLKHEYFTNVGDVLIRLSAPYTATVIDEGKDNLLVSQHFSIIRCLDGIVNPQYLRWWLSQNRKQFYKSASGATLMGTISSGYIGELTFAPPPFDVQQRIGELLKFSLQEAALLKRLSEAKSRLINAAIIKITTKTTEVTTHDQ